MDYNGFFGSKNRKHRKRTPEERKNIRKIWLAALAGMLMGIVLFLVGMLVFSMIR